MTYVERRQTIELQDLAGKPKDSKNCTDCSVQSAQCRIIGVMT